MVPRIDGGCLEPAHAAHAPEEPEHDENEHHHAKNAAESGPAVATVSVISAAAAEHQDDNDDEENQAHWPPSSMISFDVENPGTSLFLQRIPRCVLDAADGVLNLAFGLVRLAVGFHLCVAGQLADSLLYRALELLRRSGDPILVHGDSLLGRRAVSADPHAVERALSTLVKLV